MNQQTTEGPVRTAIEISIYLLLIFMIVVWCVQILAPFVSFLLWGTIIAVAVYNPYKKLRAKVGENGKLAVTLFALIGVSVVIVPAWMFAGSIVESGQEVKVAMDAGEYRVPPPGESVKEWPLIGERTYAAWSQASSNLEQFIQRHQEQFTSLAQKLIKGVAGTAVSILQLIASILIAAVLLANDAATVAAIRRFFSRLVGDAADEVIDLTAATIRSVTIGVLGIAFIQAVLGGLGMLAVGIPAAGVWALFILILAIAQLPPLLVLLPAIIYVFSTGESTTAAVIFTVWSLFVSFSDALLKPLLLGRGVEAPMLVILLGAIGGMLHSGIVGLFVGAVILALGYKMFIAWLQAGETQEESSPGDTA